jgi:hypothetical protein
MRFGRLILASLTAFAAYSYAQAAPRPENVHQSLRLLQAVVPILVHAAESTASAPALPAFAHAILSLDALHSTPLAGSIFLLASALAIHLIHRRHQKTLLRC